MDCVLRRRAFAWFYVFAAGCECDARARLCDDGPPPVLERVRFVPERGLYRGPLTLVLSSDDPSAAIYYTLDGSRPTLESSRYVAPLELDDTVVVRAAVLPLQPGDAIATHTYVLEAEAGLPIVSLASHPDAWFGGDIGLFENPEERGDDWERPISVELIDPARGLARQTDAGARIHGNKSRTATPKKSLRLYFRGDYGAKRLDVTGLLWGSGPTRVKRLVLRGGYNDTWLARKPQERDAASYVHDETARRLHATLGHRASRGTFVQLLVNGAPWGVYNLAERIDEHFLEAHFGASAEGWVLVKNGELEHGDGKAWSRLRALLEGFDGDRAEHLEALEAEVDVEQLIDYVIIQAWLQNYDWPNNNWIMARSQDAGARWRFFVWDAEYAFGGGGPLGFVVDHRTLAHAGDPRQGWLGRIVRIVLDTPKLRTRLEARWAFLARGPLAPERVVALHREVAAQLAPGIAHEAARWGRLYPPGYDENAWLRAVEREQEVFVPARGAILTAELETIPR